MVYYFSSGGLKIPHLVPPFGKNIDRWAFGGGGGTQNPGVGGAHRGLRRPCLKNEKNSVPDQNQVYRVKVDYEYSDGALISEGEPAN